MKRWIPLLLAGMMSAAALAAPPAGSHLSVEGAPLAPDQIGGPAHPPRAMMDPAQREAMWAKHAKALHDKLKLKPEQEPAWNAFSSAMKPDASLQEMAKPMPNATAPERMEQHMKMMRQHMDGMQKRLDALKAFYAQLTPEQRKALDQMPPMHEAMEGKMPHQRMPISSGGGQ